MQRWLDDLEAAGVVVHEPERDDGGRRWRTQIVLQRAPGPAVHELAAARRRACRWRARERARRQTARRAPALGAIRDRSAVPAARTRARLAVARRVEEHERRRRAAVEAAIAHRELTHPFGAPPPSAPSPVSAKRCRRPETSQIGVPAVRLAARAAWEVETVVAETGAHERENEFAERLAALRRAAAERAALLAPQVEARAYEARHWPAGQRCPLGRLREAWVVYRYGLARAIDTGGASAGRVSVERVARAVGLYEAFAAHRPPGWPTSGAAALCVLAAIGRADRLAGDVANLQRLALGMRAVAGERDPVRLARACGRAERRRDGRRAQQRSIAFRMAVARAETAERRRRRVRDLVLLAGGNPASWPNAELALGHLRALADRQPRLMEPDRFEELDGIGARVTRYRDELAQGRWRLQEDLQL
ncbi:hypothetical protein [Solirubrobacter deserti]|uniref:Uncharacterized protein n=1 Tax=Solirubrobacter deserti TaxID=2282478 RepID=A0ABT4RRH2_9ACTN|nr:hypothetical protein [Solirubrobacter deserti]MDA0141183.1 hypothetical protein [Solirubrobacter deserti]